MNAFFDGMSRINMFPQISPKGDLSVKSAWDSVSKAFYSAGDNIRTAINEQTQPPTHTPDKKHGSR
jgi:hypothetical protein